MPVKLCHSLRLVVISAHAVIPTHVVIPAFAEMTTMPGWQP